MARIPQYSGGQVLPAVRPGVRVSGAPSPEAAALPGRQLQQVAQGVGAVGGVLGDIARVEQDKINKVRFNDAYNQALSEANRLKGEYSELKGAAAFNGINGRPLTDHYRDELQKALAGITNDLKAPDVRDGFLLAAGELEGKFLRDAENWFVQQSEVYNEQVRDATFVSAFDIIAANPLDKAEVTEQMGRAKSALEDKFRDAGYDGEAFDQQMSMALAKGHNAVIEGMIAGDDLAGARQYFERHQGDYSQLDAQGVPEMFARKEAELRRKRYESLSLGITQDRVRPQDLQTAYENNELDDGEYNALLVQSANAAARKESERNAAVGEWRDRNFAVLQVGINDGIMGRVDADLALEKGMITHQQWSQAARMGTERSAAAQSMDQFLDNIVLGVPIDPSDTGMKRGADEYFKRTGAADLLKGNGEQFREGMQGVVTMAVDAGIIPASAITTLRGMKASGTEQQQMFAIQAIGELYNIQPNAVDAAFTGHEVAEAISYQFKIDAGIDQATAYGAILREREARNEPPGATSITKARVAEARSLASGFDTSDAISTVDRGGFLGMFRQNRISGGALAQQQIMTDYQQAFQTYYVQHGDEDLAKKQADAVVQRTVGISRVNNSRVMLHPPERYYPGVDPEWMTETLSSAVSESMNAEIRSRDIELVSDVQTARDVRNGELPTYAVKVTTGGSEQIMPMRWSFDAEAAERRAKDADNARRRAQRASAREQAAVDAERTANTLDTAFIPTGMMTPEQVERVRETQRKTRGRADIMRERAE